MSDVPPDRGRDSELIRHLKSIAEGIFHRYGINFKDAKRAGGWSNATWLADGLALRLSVQQGKEDIRREAKLALLLPPEVGYPPILETGVTDGYEWSLSKKIPGNNLGEIWPTLDWDQRMAALPQLWKKVAAVHSVDISAAAELFCYPLPPVGQKLWIRTEILRFFFNVGRRLALFPSWRGNLTLSK